jgi:hypothetical protein
LVVHAEGGGIGQRNSTDVDLGHKAIISNFVSPIILRIGHLLSCFLHGIFWLLVLANTHLAVHVLARFETLEHLVVFFLLDSSGRQAVSMAIPMDGIVGINPWLGLGEVS